MSENPEAIREDIERTRARLGYNVDAVADKVSPSHIAHRQTEKIKGAVSDMKDRIMGTADEAVTGTRGAFSDAGDAVGRAERTVVRKAKGNPLAAGLIAFGAGMLVSALIPASEKEQELAQTLKEKAQPLAHELGEAASEAAQNLKEPAREAMDSVKVSAREGAENVRAEAQVQGDMVKDRAQEAQQNIRET